MIAKFKHNVKKKLLILVVGFLVVGAVALVVWSNRNASVQAAWFDDNFGYRQTVAITNSGSAQTNYQVQVILGTGDLVVASKMQSDCDDVRFTDASGKVIPYWNEYCFSAAGKNSSFWLYFDSLPAGSTTVFVYYGNPAANSVSLYRANPSGINIGTGNDGTITVSSNSNINTTTIISGRSCADGGDAVNYSVTENRTSGTSQIVLSTTPAAGCLAAGDEVLIVNLQGTSSNNSNVGQYEFARINSIATATLTLNHSLANGYDGSTQKIMVQRMPNYGNVTVNSSINFTATAWNGTKNGVVAFRSNGTVTATGNIHANSLGYAGGAGGAAGANGGNNGESYDGSNGTGGSGVSGNQTNGGGESANTSTARPNDEGNRGGGGGGGSNGSLETTNLGPGGAGGGGYGGGGGGGGGGDPVNLTVGGTGGSGATSTGTFAGGGGGGCRGGSSTLAGAGGNAGSNGADGVCDVAAGQGGLAAATSASTGGGGGGAAQANNGGGAGGGGGGLYGSASLLSNIYLGSGGGGGGGQKATIDRAGVDGSAAGGIVYIGATTITVTGTTTANGGDATAGSASGTASGAAGSGGSVFLTGSTVTMGSSIVTTNGGASVNAGGRGGGAGGGGVGRIDVYYSSASGSTSPTANTSTLPVAGSAASEEKSPGPVAFWRFDDGTGTNAQDSTTNNNDGTISGATWQTEDMCVSGKCLSFDGVDDLVNAGSATNLDDLGPLTYSAWIKPITSGEGTYGRIIAKVNASLDGTSLSMNGSNGLYFIVDRATTTMLCNIASGVTLNTWQQVMVTWDGNLGCSGVYFYINGVRQNTVAEQNGSGARTSDASNNLYIGNEPGATRTFNGFIDEPKIYNYARSADQVKLDYNSKQAALAKGAGTILGAGSNAALNQGLVGYWKLNESSGNAADASGNALTLTNNGTTTYVAGKFGNGSEHVPASSQYLSTATIISGVKSVSFWTNPDSTTNYFVSLTSGAYVTAASGVLSATGFTSPKIYVNGVAATTIVADVWQLVTVTTETAINADTFYVGRQGANYYDGTLDEVRTYNRTLSPAEVSTLYNFAPGPVGYWKMEEGNGTTTVDVSGNGYTSSTFTNNVAWVTGKYGKGLSFDGDADAVRIPDSTSTAIDIGATTDSFTIEGWLKTTTNGSSTACILGKDGGSGAYPGLLCLNSSEQAFFQIKEVSSPFNYPNLAGSAALNDGQWHHLAGVRDVATDKLYLYVDGILVNSTTDTTASSLANNTDWAIGNSGTSYAEWDFTGSIDETKIYNYTRTQKQIVEDMNAGHPAPGSPVGSAVGYWKFDDGYGTTAQDSSINNNDGTLNTFASPATATSGWTNSGKFGKALAFDGVDDYVDVGKGTSVRGLSQYSISAWVNTRSIPSSNVDFIYNESVADVANTSRVALGLNNVEDGPGTQFEFKFRTGTSGSTIRRVFGTSTPSINTWYHVVATFNSDTDKYRLYVNGVLENTLEVAESSVADTAPADNITIGADTINNENWPGTIDEVQVYAGALTAEEVKVNYNQSQALVLGTAGNNSNYASQASNQQYCVPGDTSSCNPPVGEWKMEEGSGTTINDSSGNGKTSSAFTGNVAWTTGKYGKGLVFDGTDDVVRFTEAAQFDLGATTDSYTVQAWYKTSASCPAAKTLIVTKNDGSGAWPYEIKLNDTCQVDFQIYDGTNFSNAASGNAMNDGQWHFITGVRDVATDKVYVYNDGRLIASATDTTTATTANNDDLSIGNGGTSYTTNDFNGSIDEVKIYNYARTQAQIAYDYNRGKPVAHWKFDECQGTTLNDSISGTNSATLTIGTAGNSQTSAGTCVDGLSTSAWANGKTGKFNYSVNFDGADDLAAVTTGLNTIQSVSFWAKPSSSSGTIPFVTLATAPAINVSSSNLVLSATGLTTPTYYVNGQPGTTLTVSAWNHIVVTTGTSFSANAITWGFVSPTYFKGQLDAMKIFNYQLTNYQVRTEFNQSAAVRFGPLTGTP